MTSDAIAETALLEISRAQRTAWESRDYLAHWYWLMVDGGTPEADALAIIESVRREEEAEHRRAA
jgi:hypothetical protein